MCKIKIIKKKKLVTPSFFLLWLVDIQGAEAWFQLLTLQDAELKDLASSLIGTVLESRAASTTKKYYYAIN